MQLLVVPWHVPQLGSQDVHTPLMTISSVFVHAAAQVLELVTTNEPEHEVQVLVVDAQVRHDELQAIHCDPLSIVFPVSHEVLQTLSLKSSFILP